MLRYGVKSLWNRRFVAALTVLSIALSVALLLGVERLRSEAKAGFATSASRIGWKRTTSAFTPAFAGVGIVADQRQ
jgi:hypothetical protein